VSWYRCPCGFVTEATPQFGDSIVSLSHLHRAARVDGGSSIVRMEEIPDLTLECVIACAIGSRDNRGVLSDGGARLYPREAENSRPRRLAA
jgi:hypothetical protein